ncbi:hypothetical protein [Burkholderia multivorans]|uniref:hypothetical protein n=1 Tax=Burkholderia multivorans TaxID=87883 RepID=UPI0011B1DC24|nr:hypothetical protein [Burkholderia multivorans]MBU9298628.1 hypothetical protein [Burkholderia multivorans]MBU9302208.1 hypothetical protein [Burkholderia multivorans]MBU9504410.1 hypothetical protein [Burkholderia multivorans]MBU9510466.1 hypothetical protein [Burkholderia multivorans]MCA8463462.1 hypothetical protein [Burkholderia multivorans]
MKTVLYRRTSSCGKTISVDRSRSARENPPFKTREFLMPFLGHFRLTETGKNPLKHRIRETDSGQRGGKSEQL